jgi:ribosome maturation factor RimP
LFVGAAMDLSEAIERTIAGLGCELVDAEYSNHGRHIRVFIDKDSGITVDDCARVSNQLTRVLAVEGADYDRLEVSSPGLDRPLKQVKDFQRFEGEKAKVRLRLPVDGRRNFVGILRDVGETGFRMEVEGNSVSIEYSSIEKARLVPTI